MTYLNLLMAWLATEPAWLMSTVDDPSPFLGLRSLLTITQWNSAWLSSDPSKGRSCWGRLLVAQNTESRVRSQYENSVRVKKLTNSSWSWILQWHSDPSPNADGKVPIVSWSSTHVKSEMLICLVVTTLSKYGSGRVKGERNSSSMWEKLYDSESNQKSGTTKSPMHQMLRMKLHRRGALRILFLLVSLYRSS